MKLFNRFIFKEGGRNPQVDWSMVIIVFLIIVLVFIFNSIFLYQRVISGDIVEPGTENFTKNRTFNQKDFNSLLSDFSTKADTYSKVKSGYAKFSDPSRL
jgi:hypothetical protein